MRLTIFPTPARTIPIRIAFLLAAVAFSRRADAQATSAADSTAVVAAVERSCSTPWRTGTRPRRERC